MTAPIYHSKIFWHFCGRNKSEHDAYQTLSSILTQKILYIPDSNNLKGESLVNEHGEEVETIALQHACFADIPFSFLKHHIGKYGNIGIGFKGSFLIAKGAQPVIYVAGITKKKRKNFHGQTASSIIENLRRERQMMINLLKPSLGKKERKEIKELSEKLEILRHYIKQFSVTDPKSAYYEREWRIINSFSFKLTDIELVILPKRFSQSFTEKFPNVPYSISELILS
jgi:hypothetical protein